MQHSMFRENVKYSWEMVKFYTTLCSTLLMILFAFFGVLFSNEVFLMLNNQIKIWILIIPIFLSSFIFVISYIGRENFTRECNRLYEQLAIVMKLESRMGLHDNLRNIKEKEDLFKNDDHYIPNRWRKEFNNKSEEDYVKEMMSENRDSFYTKSLVIFNAICIMSVLIILFDIYIIFTLFLDP